MKLIINSTAIKYDTGRASLIKIPKKQHFFWLTNKCVYPDGYKTNIYINPDYTYLGEEKGKKIEYSGDEIITEFEGSEASVKSKENYIYHHKPEKKEVVHVEADDELKR